MATRTQLAEAGVAPPTAQLPPAPWHRIQGPDDASTLWYAVMVHMERGIFIGALSFRHSDYHTLLLERGWRELAVSEIGVDGARAGGSVD